MARFVGWKLESVVVGEQRDPGAAVCNSNHPGIPDVVGQAIP